MLIRVFLFRSDEGRIEVAKDDNQIGELVHPRGKHRIKIAYRLAERLRISVTKRFVIEGGLRGRLLQKRAIDSSRLDGCQETYWDQPEDVPAISKVLSCCVYWLSSGCSGPLDSRDRICFFAKLRFHACSDSAEGLVAW